MEKHERYRDIARMYGPLVAATCWVDRHEIAAMLIGGAVGIAVGLSIGIALIRAVS